jgi:hypothetical protein
MRYYSITISPALSEFPPAPGASIPGAQWDSWINDENDPSAQQIEFSIEMQEDTAPTANSTLIIKGVSWDQIKVANRLVNGWIHIYAGMKPGLPLATAQSIHDKDLFSGKIIKCWGNWEGTEMSLGFSFGSGEPSKEGDQKTSEAGGAAQQAIQTAQSLVGGGGGASPAQAAKLRHMRNIEKLRYKRTGFRSIDRKPFARGPSVTPMGNLGGGFDMSGFGVDSGLGGGDFFGGGVPGLSQPLNLIHNMMPNSPLSGAIEQMLSKAFPGANINTRIHPGLKLPYQDAGMYQSLPQVAGYLKDLSRSILGTKNYNGIRMSHRGNNIDVWDGTQPPINRGIIQVIDIIGQPTWVNQFQIHLKTVLRADLHVGDTFELPPNIIMALGPDANPLGDQGSASPQRTHLTVEGMTFRIYRILHVGDFRSPHGSDWSTNYEAEVAGEGGVTPPGADTGEKINQSNQQQNPTDAPTSEEPPSSTIPGLPTQPPLSTAPQSFGVIPPLPRDRSTPTTFGSVYRRDGIRRYGRG